MPFSLHSQSVTAARECLAAETRIVSFLTSEHHALVHGRDGEQHTPLFYAAKYMNIPAANRLLAAGASCARATRLCCASCVCTERGGGRGGERGGRERQTHTRTHALSFPLLVPVAAYFVLLFLVPRLRAAECKREARAGDGMGQGRERCFRCL